MRLYDRLWTDAEIRGHGGLVERLHREPTLFRVTARGGGQSEHGGPLSLKTARSGKAVYHIGKRSHSVVPGRMLLVPPGERYTTCIDAGGAEVMTFYFPAAFYKQMLAIRILPLDRLLEGATLDRDDPFGFPPHQGPIDARMENILARLDRSQIDPAQAGEDVLAAVVTMACQASGHIARAPASRECVRKELFRRTSWAREQIESELARDVPLIELARTACLSPFHLHRAFTDMFGETPGAFRHRRRMERTQELLLTTDAPIRDIARSVGFRDHSAFSRAFRRSCGQAPSAFRRLSRR